MMDLKEIKANLSFTRVIDISQPISTSTACFPGDTPFSREVTLSYEESKVINLTAFKMSPHVGTHADAPVHIKGCLSTADGAACDDTAGIMPLTPFLGRTYVMDLAPLTGPITGEAILEQLSELATDDQIKRVLFKTRDKNRHDVFEDDYSYIGEDTAEKLGELGFLLTGLDTPSVDHTQSKELATHRILDRYKLSWLENLDLSEVEEGEYELIALPLKFVELEASPVRAILLA
ncbi:MAG: cyclase family protein [Cyanobacteria bacterium SZAS LIN-3]|nr:cyclase family protein [Cyanobacteria bacterium SZAS LIN-3]